MLTKQPRPLGMGPCPIILLCVQCAGGARPGAVLRAWGLADLGWGQRDSPRLWVHPGSQLPAPVQTLLALGGRLLGAADFRNRKLPAPFFHFWEPIMYYYQLVHISLQPHAFCCSCEPCSSSTTPCTQSSLCLAERKPPPNRSYFPREAEGCCGADRSPADKSPGAERGGARRYLGLCAGRAGGAGRCLGPLPAAGASRQPQQPLSRTCRCSSSSEWVKAGLSRELADASQERDQYWAETSSSRQKRR